MSRLRHPLLAAVVLALAVAGTAAGAEPTLGMSLGATDREVIVESSATVPALVNLTAPEGWQLEMTTFALEPGGRQAVAIVKRGVDGQVVATMTALQVAKGVDRSTLVLSLGMPKPAPNGLPWLLLLPTIGVVLAVVGLFVIPRRNRHARAKT